MSFDYDLFVIGGGSGGVRAARIAASQHGARVGLAEESRMGGTCVIRGCVPKKLMVYASQGPELMAEAQGYGWTQAAAGAFDWPYFRQKLRRELDRLEGAYTNGLTAAGVTVHHSRAHLVDAHTVELADGLRFRARHILIAVGGRPTRLDIPGAELGLISDDLFEFETLPPRVLLVGSGFIACEYAAILNGLGSKVEMVFRADRVLRGFDELMRDLQNDQLISSGIGLRMNTTPQQITQVDGGLRMAFSTGEHADYDAIIFATGRTPHTQGLGLENTGLTLGDKGQIIVDQWSQTAVPSIFAVGDVTEQVNLTPVAIRQGHDFADTVFGGTPKPTDLSLVASAVYTRPHEVGTAGLTEDEAAARGPVRVYEASFRAMRTMFAGSDQRTVMKLLVDAHSDKVLGCHIFGPEAGEMIQLVAIAMGMGATKADFDRTIAVHPTIAEELVTMRTPVRELGAMPDKG